MQLKCSWELACTFCRVHSLLQLERKRAGEGNTCVGKWKAVPAAPGFSRPELPLPQSNSIDTNLLENS